MLDCNCLFCREEKDRQTRLDKRYIDCLTKVKDDITNVYEVIADIDPFVLDSNIGNDVRDIIHNINKELKS